MPRTLQIAVPSETSEVVTEVAEVAEGVLGLGADAARLGLALGIGALLGVLVSVLAVRAVFRFWRSPFAVQARRRGRFPWRLAGASLGAMLALRVQRLDADVRDVVSQVLVLLLVTALTWLAVQLLHGAEAAAIEVHDTGQDDLLARRRRTQFLVLRRVGTAVVVLVGLSTALLTFPAARAVGTSLLASAGLLGIVAGVAAQGALRNLVAGVQIAVAEPIRLGDAVFVDGEWGTIEDITLTNVIVQVWDKRRLVYPTSWFAEQPFQNWTRKDQQLIGQVTLVLDHRADVRALRAEAERFVTAHELWDGDFWIVQVTDATVDGITVRVLMTAPDAQTTFQLRCDVREHLVAWIAANDPDGLPRRRLLVGGDGEPPTG